MPVDNPVSSRFLEMRHGKTLSLLDGKAPKSILDAGCGSGEFLERFSERFPSAKIYGCDILRDDVECAKKACPRGKFYCGDFLGLDFGPVELVAMLEVLEHSDDVELMLKKAASLVGKGGYVLISIPRPEVLHWRAIWWAWSRTFGRKWYGQHGKMSEAELDALASRCGLVKEKRERFFLDSISITLYRVDFA